MSPVRAEDDQRRAAVIFDMDGVLVDSAGPHHESWQVLARQHGLQVSREDFAATFGRPSRDILRMLFGADLTPTEIAALDAEKETAYRELVRGRVVAMPGAGLAVHGLQAAGLALAVASSGPPENIALVLDELRLADAFAVKVNGFDVAHGKPAPDCFLLAAERLGVAPAACVVVEDAPVGVQAGVAAGMQVIGLAEDATRQQQLKAAGAVRCLTTLAELTPACVTGLLTGRER